MAKERLEDVVLYIDKQSIDETYLDPRANPAGSGQGRDVKMGRLYNTQGNIYYNYGGQLQKSLMMGPGYSVEVYDYDTEVVVKISYENNRTGKGASQCFIILLDDINKTGRGVVKSTIGRIRSVSNISQAASYIRAKAGSLASRCATAD